MGREKTQSSIRIYTRKADITMRINPGWISKTNRSIVVIDRELQLESPQPLTFTSSNGMNHCQRFPGFSYVYYYRISINESEFSFLYASDKISYISPIIGLVVRSSDHAKWTIPQQITINFQPEDLV